MEEVKDNLSQLKLHEDPLEAGNILASSFGTFDDLENITFSHFVPSPGITLEGLASLQTPDSRIDPHDQSSTSVAATTSRIPEAPPIIASSLLPTNQGGAPT